MFFPERIQRLRLVVHESLKDRVVKRLHELGTVQITDFREKLSDDSDTWAALLEGHPPSQDIRRATTLLMSVNRLLDIFDAVDPEPEENFFKTLFSPSAPQKIVVDDMAGEDLFRAADADISSAEAAVADPFATLEQNGAQKSELVAQQQMLQRVSAVDVALEDLGEGTYVTAVLGVAHTRDFTLLEQEISTATAGRFCFAEEKISESESCLLVVCLVSDSDDVAACLRKWDMERIHAGEYSGTPAGAVAAMQQRIDACDAAQQTSRRQIAEAGRTWRVRMKGIREQLLIERDRAEIYAHFAKTRHVTAIEGWITARQSADVLEAVKAECGGLAIAEVTEPDAPPEKLPVSLDNPGILRHFELLVKLYAPPKYDEIDPTVLIVPSFLFFFGLMITDAMYGLMTLLLGVFILRGGGRYYSLYKSAGLLLTLGGISTVVLGSMTGGWFGNLATQYLGMEFLNRLVVINPMVDVSTFLLFAIGVGLLHLNLGIVVGIVKDVRRKNRPEALKSVWIFFLELSLLCLYLDSKTAAVVFAVPALLMLLYSEKGMALFGITGLLGDTLSYARLMALGLVSFGLAVAINALAKMVGGIQYVGWLLALVVLLVGHVFSFVLNLMGAFAHGIRLHFVEFFGKFYSGGGDEFLPFKIKRDITQVK